MLKHAAAHLFTYRTVSMIIEGQEVEKKPRCNKAAMRSVGIIDRGECGLTLLRNVSSRWAEGLTEQLTQ